jgi:hypothetical protein
VNALDFKRVATASSHDHVRFDVVLHLDCTAKLVGSDGRARSDPQVLRKPGGRESSVNGAKTRVKTFRILLFRSQMTVDCKQGERQK